MTDSRAQIPLARAAIALYDTLPRSPWTPREGYLISLVTHWRDCGALDVIRALLFVVKEHEERWAMLQTSDPEGAAVELLRPQPCPASLVAETPVECR